MANLDVLALRPPDDGGEATAAANTQTQLTLAAKAGYCWVVVGYTMSTDGNVAAKMTPTIVSGAKTIDKFQAPAALPLDRVVELTRGFKCPVNTSVVATIPAAGAGIVSTVVVRAFLIPDPF